MRVLDRGGIESLDAKTIGDRIFYARIKRGMSQGDLANQLSVSMQAVSQWERNVSEPRPPRAREVADILGVSAAWLMTGEAPLPDFDLGDFVPAIRASNRSPAREQDRNPDSVAGVNFPQPKPGLIDPELAQLLLGIDALLKSGPGAEALALGPARRLVEKLEARSGSKSLPTNTSTPS